MHDSGYRYRQHKYLYWGRSTIKTYFVERITTTIGKTNLEYAITLKSILEIYQIEPKEIEGRHHIFCGSSVKPHTHIRRQKDYRNLSEAGRFRYEDRAEHPDGQSKVGRQ